MLIKRRCRCNFLSCYIAASASNVPRQMQTPWGFSLSCADVTAFQEAQHCSALVLQLNQCALALGISYGEYSKCTAQYALRLVQAVIQKMPKACQLWQLSQPCVMHEGSGLVHEGDAARETRARPETFLTVARNTIAHKVTMSQGQVSLWGSSLSSCMQCLDCPTVIERYMWSSNASCCQYRQHEACISSTG